MVWHSSLTKQNEEDLERVQKSAVKIILGKDYEKYDEALAEANLELLRDRRQELSLKFAIKCLKSTRTNEMFPKREKEHLMQNRNSEKYEVQSAKTNRLKNSAIPYMQRLLNNQNEDLRKRKPG